MAVQSFSFAAAVIRVESLSGLEDLLSIEPAFSEFQKTLFSQASVGLERGVQSNEVNEKPDTGILLFLARPSPHFLLKPVQKCIEWLIHSPPHG
uniref:HEAT repeat-containing protein 1 n=1 Tax=Oncorhynchus tshawytscha TaxID=74940 RepID=A0AAZ3S299_ONCTS